MQQVDMRFVSNELYKLIESYKLKMMEMIKLIDEIPCTGGDFFIYDERCCLYRQFVKDITKIKEIIDNGIFRVLDEVSNLNQGS